MTQDDDVSSDASRTHDDDISGVSGRTQDSSTGVGWTSGGSRTKVDDVNNDVISDVNNDVSRMQDNPPKIGRKSDKNPRAPRRWRRCQACVATCCCGAIAHVSVTCYCGATAHVSTTCCCGAAAATQHCNNNATALTKVQRDALLQVLFFFFFLMTLGKFKSLQTLPVCVRKRETESKGELLNLV
jgi:hypothetical protein